MVRLVFCFVRQSNVSTTDFRQYWRSPEHREKIDSLVALFQPDRWADTLSHPLPDIEQQLRQFIGRGTQYDAVVEFFWDDPSIVRERLSDPAIGSLLKVLRDQSVRRVDPDQSTIFLTDTPEPITHLATPIVEEINGY